jgi:putative ABC transport system permease protein
VSGSSPNEDLKDGRGAGGTRGGRTRDALVALEIAVALALLIGAGLLLRSFNGLAGVDTGIDQHSLLTFSVDAPGGRATPPAQQVAFYERLLERIHSLPGVARAGAAVTLPIGGDDFSTQYIADGAPLPPPGQEPSAGWQIVSRGYFDAIGMRVLSGRGFHGMDSAGSAPVVIVNETLARQAWTGADAVGRRVRFSRDTADPWRTVVGVVSDMRHRGPGAPVRPEIYQPLAQRSFSSMAFVVRTSVPPQSVVPLIRAELSAIAPAVPIARVATMDEHVARALSRPRFLSVLTSSFGALAAALAMVGIYGVMACAVAERTREIAIRIALGARGADVVRMVVLKAAALAGVGLIAGLLLAWASSRLLAGLLFGVTPGDALTYVASASGLLAVALLAAVVPARRAARIDGSRVLRS